MFQILGLREDLSFLWRVLRWQLQSGAPKLYISRLRLAHFPAEIQNPTGIVELFQSTEPWSEVMDKSPLLIEILDKSI